RAGARGAEDGHLRVPQLQARGGRLAAVVDHREQLHLALRERRLEPGQRVGDAALARPDDDRVAHRAASGSGSMASGTASGRPRCIRSTATTNAAAITPAIARKTVRVDCARSYWMSRKTCSNCGVCGWPWGTAPLSKLAAILAAWACGIPSATSELVTALRVWSIRIVPSTARPRLDAK